MFDYCLLIRLFPFFPLTQMCCSQEVTGEEKNGAEKHPEFFLSVFLRAPVLDHSLLLKFDGVQHTAVTQQYLCDRS